MMTIRMLKSLEETFEEAIKELRDLNSPDLTLGIRQTLEAGLFLIQKELYADDIIRELTIMKHSGNIAMEIIARYAKEAMESEK